MWFFLVSHLILDQIQIGVDPIFHSQLVSQSILVFFNVVPFEWYCPLVVLMVPLPTQVVPENRYTEGQIVLGISGC